MLQISTSEQDKIIRTGFSLYLEQPNKWTEYVKRFKTNETMRAM
jgi:hypothetical protein